MRHSCTAAVYFLVFSKGLVYRVTRGKTCSGILEVRGRDGVRRSSPVTDGWLLVSQKGRVSLKRFSFLPDFYLQVARALVLASPGFLLEKSASGDGPVLSYCPPWCTFHTGRSCTIQSRMDKSFTLPDINHPSKCCASN